MNNTANTFTGDMTCVLELTGALVDVPRARLASAAGRSGPLDVASRTGGTPVRLFLSTGTACGLVRIEAAA